MDFDSDDSSGVYSTSPSDVSPDADVEALRRLSDALAAAFLSPALSFCSDATIHVTSHVSTPVNDTTATVNDGADVAVHRCILAARSPFFRAAFAARRDEPPPVRLELAGILAGGGEVGRDAVVAVVGYLYGGKVAPLPAGVCACVDERCGHEACGPAVGFMGEVLCVAFGFEVFELVNLFQVRERWGFDGFGVEKAGF